MYSPTLTPTWPSCLFLQVGLTPELCQFPLDSRVVFFYCHFYKNTMVFWEPKGFETLVPCMFDSVYGVQTVFIYCWKNIIHEMVDATSHTTYSPTFHAVASRSDRVLVAHFPSWFFRALLLICNVSVCPVCSQQTNIKLSPMPRRLYEHRYEASVLKRSPLFWAEMFSVCSTFKVKY